MVFGECALAVERGRHRQRQQLRQLHKLAGRLRIKNARADIDVWPLRLRELVYGLVNGRRGSAPARTRRLALTGIYLKSSSCIEETS